jgi:hypothetical protein
MNLGRMRWWWVGRKDEDEKHYLASLIDGRQTAGSRMANCPKQEGVNCGWALDCVLGCG